MPADGVIAGDDVARQSPACTVDPVIGFHAAARAAKAGDVTKSDTRRAAILDALADHMLAHGLAASSLRPLAKAAGLSDRMLLYYFKDKSEIVAATMETIAARQMALMGAAAGPRLPLANLRVRLAASLLAEDAWPYMRLWLEAAALAAQGDVVFAGIGERIGRAFLAWGAAQIEAETPEAQALDAARLLTMFEGMVLLKSIGMEDVARLAIA
jgi:AcrR family transcriptional regulator